MYKLLSIKGNPQFSSITQATMQVFGSSSVVVVATAVAVFIFEHRIPHQMNSA